MDYVNAVSAQSERLSEHAPAWMRQIQQRGRAVWKTQTWPNKKTEAWRYTHLGKIQNAAFLTGNETVPTNLGSQLVAGKVPLSKEKLTEVLKAKGIDFQDVCRVVFVDGEYTASLSDQNIPAGMTLQPFSELSDKEASALSNKLGSIAESEKHFFVAQSESLLHNGLYLAVQEKIKIEVPIYLLYISTGHAPSSNPRLFVELADEAKIDLVEHYVCADGNKTQLNLENTCAEFSLAREARLNHYRLNMNDESCLHVGGVHSSLGPYAVLNSFYLALGTQLTRIDANVKHVGEGAHTDMQGVYLPRNTQHVDFHTNLEHCVPQTSSNEIFRGIIADSARAVFNGRIHIHPQAQQTNAQLSNKNLLTSNKAEVDTKPELEIYANDVKCAHGATVAQLNDVSLHYLRTRGISEDEARVMLSFGFINELIEKVQLQAVVEYLLPILAQRFSRDPALIRHLL